MDSGWIYPVYPAGRLTSAPLFMLNVLDQTAACRAAVDASAGWILQKNQEAHLREAPTGLNFGPPLAQCDVLDV